jgi:hypothetical protein
MQDTHILLEGFSGFLVILKTILIGFNDEMCRELSFDSKDKKYVINRRYIDLVVSCPQYIRSILEWTDETLGYDKLEKMENALLFINTVISFPEPIEGEEQYDVMYEKW